MAQSIILYSSPNMKHPGAQMHKLFQRGQRTASIYIRSVIFDGNIDEALDKAGGHMLPGETVLNTIQYPES